MTTRRQNGPSSFSQTQRQTPCVSPWLCIDSGSERHMPKDWGIMEGEDTGKTFLLQKNRGKTFVCRKMLLYLPSRKQ